MREIVENIIRNADELLGEETNDINYCELLAYSEALTIIRDFCSGYDVKKIGLDFDIEAKYLGVKNAAERKMFDSRCEVIEPLKR